MTDENEMSSEEVEEKGLAQEALDATASADEGETSPAEDADPKMVPVAKHIALRRRAQQAEIDKARAEGELNAMKRMQQKAAPPVKSPVELEIERQAAEGVPEDEVVITNKTYIKQRQYEQQVENQAAQAATELRLAESQRDSITAAQVVHEDWQEVIDKGQKLLTKGERLDVTSSGDDFGEVAYAKCKAALERAKPKANAKSETETITAPEKKQSKSEAAKKEALTQEEILKAADVTVAAAAQL